MMCQNLFSLALSIKISMSVDFALTSSISFIVSLRWYAADRLDLTRIKKSEECYGAEPKSHR
jgi:hypothetical protein